MLPDSTADDDEIARGLYRLYVVALEPEVMNTRKFAQIGWLNCCL